MQMDMSPMIDMVFLLLIFFMVASTLIVLRKDPEVKPPITPEGKVPEVAEGRILINVYSEEAKERAGHDTFFYDVDSNPLVNEDAVLAHIREGIAENEARNLEKTIIFLRGDREAVVRQIKQVMTWAAAAGINDVIFSGYQTDR